MSTAYGKKTVALVKLVADLMQSQRTPSETEQAQLADWYGWGGMRQAFETDTDEQWKAIGVDLMLNLGQICGARGINEARMAVTTSYFTDAMLAQAVWHIVTSLGFTGGNVLEPGCGTGSFLTQAPAGLPIKAVGVERDPFSALVAQLRLPEAEIIHDKLQKVALPRQKFDLVIGNVPFADIDITDPDERLKFSLHNFFLWYGLRALRPGGLLAAITSRYTLDTLDASQRCHLERYGDFLGAIRLPAGAHRVAKTDVITDILVFQRHRDGIKAESKPWHELSEEVVPGLRLNEYFAHHPERIVGTASKGRGQYGPNELVIKKPFDLQSALGQVVDDFLAEAQRDGRPYVPRKDLTVIDETLVPKRSDGYLEGSFYLHEGKLIQIVQGKCKPVTRCQLALTALVKVRDAAVALLDAEQDLDRPDEDLLPLRQALNRAYDAYVRQYGPILRSSFEKRKKKKGDDDDGLEEGETVLVRKLPRELQAFKTDFHYTTVIGLVEYDDKTGQEKKSDIFFKRIHHKAVPRTRARDISEAVSISLDQYGRLDLPLMAQLLSTTVDMIPTLLGDMAYEDPRTGQWIPADEYLSGKVRQKLAIARKAVEQQGPRFQRNVDALEPVIPSDLAPEDIHGELGVTWVDPRDIAQFCLELTKVRVKVEYESVTACWSVSATFGPIDTAAATSTWGTRRMNAIKLIEIGLNKRIPVVWDLIKEEGREYRVKNVDESTAAQEKLKEISERFTSWIWEDPERAKRLAARYNEIFRGEVARKYDGTFLTFPDMSPVWASRMYPWQRNFVARMLSSRSALCVHPVGAGKTMSMIAGAMKLRQLGFVNRVGIVVPNHLLEQIASEAKRLYPKARILLISRDDLTRERKGIFAARVATGDYDLVVLTHSALYKLGMHPENERAYLEEKLTLYRQFLVAQEAEEDSEGGMKRRTIKQMQKKIARMEEKQEQLLKKEVDGVTFEQIGLSCLFVDEAQFYKNLGLPSNTEGFQVDSSKRATDLEMKLRWLEHHTDGPFAAFFSATPWSNSMVEAYVMAWYLDQQRLFDYGLDSVDAFISNFIEISSEVEVSPDGSSFQNKSRPRSFFNLTDLMDMLAQFADIQTSEILDAKRPRKAEYTIPVDPTPEMEEFVAGLVKRAEDIHSGLHPMHNGHEDNMLCVVHDGRELAVSPRQVGILTGRSPKVEAVAKQMFQVWQQCQRIASALPGEHKSLQIGFCDIGTPSAERGEQVYGELKHALIELGLPAKSIRYVHEAKNDAEKAELFRQCREGSVAVLLGSTEKLGTGTNIQDRCAAIHIIAPPWRPDMIEQCIGRAHRPGNCYSTIHVYRYVVKRTFDAYMWQTLERKAHFMAQLLSGRINERVVDAQSEMELSYAEVKAAATGDELVLEQAATDMEIGRLERLSRAFFQARERDKKEAASRRRAAEYKRKAAAHNQQLAARIAQCKLPGFKTLEGVYLEERQKIGLYLAQRVFDFLMHGARSKRLVASWSDIELHLKVEGSLENNLSVEILIGEGSESAVRISPRWLGEDGEEGPQQWRIAHAIEDTLVEAEQSYEGQFAQALAYEREAAQFDEQAAQPFPHAEEFRELMQRKLELDAYTAAVAAGKETAEQIAACRERLLAGAKKRYQLEAEKATTPEIDAPITLQPEFLPAVAAEHDEAPAEATPPAEHDEYEQQQEQAIIPVANPLEIVTSPVLSVAASEEVLSRVEPVEPRELVAEEVTPVELPVPSQLPAEERPPVEPLPANVIPLSLFAPEEQAGTPQMPAQGSRKRRTRTAQVALPGWLALVPTAPSEQQAPEIAGSSTPAEEEEVRQVIPAPVKHQARVPATSAARVQQSALERESSAIPGEQEKTRAARPASEKRPASVPAVLQRQVRPAIPAPVSVAQPPSITLIPTYRYNPAQQTHWLQFPAAPDQGTLRALHTDGWHWERQLKQWLHEDPFAHVPFGMAYQDGGECECVSTAVQSRARTSIACEKVPVQHSIAQTEQPQTESQHIPAQPKQATSPLLVRATEVPAPEAIYRRNSADQTHWLQFPSAPANWILRVLHAEGWRWQRDLKQWMRQGQGTQVPAEIPYRDGGECEYRAASTVRNGAGVGSHVAQPEHRQAAQERASASVLIVHLLERLKADLHTFETTAQQYREQQKKMPLSAFEEHNLKLFEQRANALRKDIAHVEQKLASIRRQSERQTRVHGTAQVAQVSRTCFNSDQKSQRTLLTCTVGRRMEQEASMK